MYAHSQAYVRHSLISDNCSHYQVIIKATYHQRGYIYKSGFKHVLTMRTELSSKEGFIIGITSVLTLDNF